MYISCGSTNVNIMPHNLYITETFGTCIPVPSCALLHTCRKKRNFTYSTSFIFLL